MTVPAVDLPAEQAVLGAMLANASAAERGSAALHREDFYGERERRVFDAIVATLAGGGVPDVLTVAARLGTDGDLHDYVHTLADACLVATNVQHYIEIVRDYSVRRRLVRAIDEMQALAATNNLPTVKLQRRCVDLLAVAAPTTVAADTEQPRPRSYSGPEIAAMVSEMANPVVLYAEPGCMFDLVAPSKLGKTTLMLLACRAALHSEPFLDLPTQSVPILYLTEQTKTSFKNKLATVGFLPLCADFHTLFIADFMGASWEEISVVIREEVRKWAIGLLIVDTLSDWAHLENENDNAEALRAVRPLRALAQEANAAVVTVRHTGKGRHDSDDVVDAGRGASAFVGIVDTTCVLGRAPGQGHSNRRQLRFQSREEGLPESLLIELKAGQYVSLGEASNVEFARTSEFVLTHLPRREDAALTEKAIIAAGQGAFSRRTLERVLKGKRGVGGLLGEGRVTGKMGAGSAAANAFGYWLVNGGDEGQQLGLSDGD